MSTTRFACRTDKPDKTGLCPIELIYQITQQRKKTFIKQRKIHPVNWSVGDQAAVYIPAPKAKKIFAAMYSPDGLPPGVQKIDEIILTEYEVKTFNSNLAGIRNILHSIEQRFVALSKGYTIHEVIAEYKAGQKSFEQTVDDKNSVCTLMARYIDDHSSKFTKGTVTIYETLLKDLQGYEVAQRRILLFDDINYAFFQGFQNYLIKSGRLNNNTIAKKLSYLKTVVNYAVDKCDIAVNPNYRKFEIRREEPKIIALTQAEFDRLLNFNFVEQPRLGRVRDVFCFSCSSGLRMSDLKQLRWDHIQGDEINLVIQKTSAELSIPLNKISAAILDKYSGEKRPLPVISNQRLNDYIKEACEKAEINEPIEIVKFVGSKRSSEILPKHKLIHVHTGRKTFVTLSLERGMLAEHVMELTGHSNYKSFKRYVDFTKSTAKVVMRKAWGELPKLKVVG